MVGKLLRANLKNTRSKILIIILTVTIAVSFIATAWMATPHTSTVWGMAYIDSPIANATVTVYDTAGNIVYEAKNATRESGFFNLDVFWLWNIPSEFKVTVKEGSIAGDPFNGTLVRYVYSYNQDQYYTINPITTFFASYKDSNPAQSYSTIEQNVASFLEIPAFTSLGNVIDTADHSTVFFNIYEFAFQAQNSQSLNDFIQELVSEANQGETHPFKNLNSVPPSGGSIMGSLFSSAASSVASGALSYVGGASMGWVMAKLGFESTDSKILEQLKEMSQKLDEINDKLNAVLADLSSISNKLDELKNALNSVQKQLEKKVSEIAAYDPLARIDSAYMTLNTYSKLNKTGDVSSKTIDEWSGSVLNPVSGIYYALTEFNMFMVGNQFDGEKGLMELLVDSMVDQLYKPGATIDRTSLNYRAKAYSLFLGFTDYFQRMLSEELKGLILLAEAHHARNETTPVKEYFDNVWQPMIQAQTALYVREVERFVAASDINHLEFPNFFSPQPDWVLNDMKSFYASNYQGPTPQNIAQIFPEADKFADQIQNGTGKFIARILYIPLSRADLTPTDVMPKFLNIKTGQTYQVAGNLSVVPYATGNTYVYYRTYNLGTLPEGTYKLVSPTQIHKSVMTGKGSQAHWVIQSGWESSLPTSSSEGWSHQYGIEESTMKMAVWPNYGIIISNDTNGRPYGYWGGLWWDTSLDV